MSVETLIRYYPYSGDEELIKCVRLILDRILYYHTPSDWAWAGGLLNCLLPALTMGVPVVSSPAQKFDPDLAFRIMAETGVRNAFIPPTALRLMMQVEKPLEKYDLKLRSIGSAVRMSPDVSISPRSAADSWLTTGRTSCCQVG